MCLITDSNIPLVAEEDIEVYKVMEVMTDKKGSPFGVPPYRPLYRYHPGKNQSSEYDITMYGNKPIKTSPSGLYYMVEAGYLHAYVDWHAATHLYTHTLLNSGGTLYSACKIVKMTVPKGTKYFLGNDNDIAAETLVWNPEEQTVKN